MRELENLKDVIDAGMCLGCGLCTLNKNPKAALRMEYIPHLGYAIPAGISEDQNSAAGFDICPGRGYRIETLASEIFPPQKSHPDIGVFQSIFAIRNTSNLFTENASSAGIMSLLAAHLIQMNEVDAAIVTDFEYTANGPRARPRIAVTPTEIASAQGSKYCPVDFSDLLKILKAGPTERRYVFIGTPCQIAGVRQIQKNHLDLGIRLYIGNFCGGFKDYRNLNRLIQIAGHKPSEVTQFRFRGGGQPGSMRVESGHKYSEIKYPEYVKMTGYNKLPRCHFCVDATAELADFSCGDAWLKRFQSDSTPTSLVVTRSQFATDLINRLAQRKQVLATSVTEKEVVLSQIGNLESKKYRQEARIRWHRWLGYKLPKIHEGYRKNNRGSIWLEARVWASHRLKNAAEKLGIFNVVYYRSRVVHKLLLKVFGDIYG